MRQLETGDSVGLPVAIRISGDDSGTLRATAERVMKALRDVNFDGIVIPDHVPGGGYPAANSSYTIGYMKALRDRANAESRRA